MQRKKLIKIHLHKLVDSFDGKDIYKLLFYFQDLEIMYGYAVATLQAFEDNKIGIRSDEKVSIIMQNGEYEKLFEEWLKEEI